MAVLRAETARCPVLARALVAALVLSWGNNAAARPDCTLVRQVRSLAPKGRAQDAAYNDDDAVRRIVALKLRAVPMLIECVSDATRIEPSPLAYWPAISVGDLSHVLLVELFSRADGRMTISKSLLPRIDSDPNRAFHEQYLSWVARHGRGPLQRSWRSVWRKYGTRLVWDDREQCIKPEGSGDSAPR